MKSHFVLTLSFVFFLAGCATPYQSNSIGGGYKETRLGENVFRVSFRGNALVSPEQASDYALLRGAELAKENGFRYFAIIDSNTYIKQGYAVMPTTTNTNVQVGTFGNSVYGTANSTTYGGQALGYIKPTSENIIACFTEKPSNANYFDVDFLIPSIKQKYGIN